MTKHLLAPVALFLALALSGCSSNGEGTLQVQVTDLPGDIADFSALPVTVSSIELTMKDGGKESYAPSDGTFDLTTLVNGNTTTLFKDDVKAGNYTRLALKVRDATGTLKSGGQVAVTTPGGTLFLEQAFTVKEGEETNFLFDVVVHKEGNGQYIFQPNASGSRVTN
ncbi:MAG: DUF4382 domain-containing protein [Candidatus Thermoplasmatota archaeon]